MEDEQDSGVDEDDEDGIDQDSGSSTSSSSSSSSVSSSESSSRTSQAMSNSSFSRSHSRTNPNHHSDDASTGTEEDDENVGSAVSSLDDGYIGRRGLNLLDTNSLASSLIRNRRGGPQPKLLPVHRLEEGDHFNDGQNKFDEEKKDDLHSYGPHFSPQKATSPSKDCRRPQQQRGRQQHRHESIQQSRHHHRNPQRRHHHGNHHQQHHWDTPQRTSGRSKRRSKKHPNLGCLGCQVTHWSNGLLLCAILLWGSVQLWCNSFNLSASSTWSVSLESTSTRHNVRDGRRHYQQPGGNYQDHPTHPSRKMVPSHPHRRRNNATSPDHQDEKEKLPSGCDYAEWQKERGDSLLTCNIIHELDLRWFLGTSLRARAATTSSSLDKRDRGGRRRILGYSNNMNRSIGNRHSSNKPWWVHQQPSNEVEEDMVIPLHNNATRSTATQSAAILEPPGRFLSSGLWRDVWSIHPQQQYSHADRHYDNGESNVGGSETVVLKMMKAGTFIRFCSVIHSILYVPYERLIGELECLNMGVRRECVC